MMAEQSWLDRLFQRPWGLLVLALYFAAVAGLQWVASPTAELDQAGQLVLSQRLNWGYTNQPPLFTWLTWSLFQLTGPSLLSLFVIKVGLLTGLMAAVYGVCQQLGFHARQRQLALSGMLLLPTVIWESQRDLTHSLSATTFAATTLCCGLWAVRRGGWWRYALLGVAAAAAMLSKHNSVVFLAGLLLAVLVTPSWRTRLDWTGAVLAGVVALLLFAPHALWLREHAQVLDQTLNKLDHGQSGVKRYVRLFREMAEGLLSFVLPWLLLAVPMWWRARGRIQTQHIMVRLVASVLFVLVLFVVAIGADSFKGRWLFPLMFFLPISLAAALPDVSARAARVMGVAALGMALLCGVVMPARLVWAMPGAAQTRQNLPMQAIAQQIEQAAGTMPGAALVSNHLIGGNMRLWWPTSVAVLTPHAPWSEPLPSTVLVVATEADLRDPDVQAWLLRVTGVASTDMAWQPAVSAVMLHRPHRKPFVVQWARVAVREGVAP
ncbi:ArnT family glycosyltransferase [Aquabacterium sp.]|uniref:ArnT family glycosyltransferase n=1 Tax=Aquabacterium sp. TaxID=1872578 RepID=UPI0035B36027